MTTEGSMPFLTEVKRGSTAKYLTMFCVFAWTAAVYYYVGNRPRTTWKPPPPRMEYFPVNVSNSLNGVHHINATDTRRLAIIAQEKRIAVLREFCRKNPDVFSRGYQSQKLTSAWFDKFVYNPRRFSYIKRLQREVWKSNFTATNRVGIFTL
ncbi:hypothetical protein Bbelb_218390 [Branchiostoma belcheri]|nr:hypothetical protein Bbelb_218390 [Branchiostoma belcheri]